MNLCFIGDIALPRKGKLAANAAKGWKSAIECATTVETVRGPT